MDKKNKKNKINWALIGKATTGSRKYLLLGAVGVILHIVFSYAIPLVTSFTIDFVIGRDQVSMPAFLEKFIASIGGREFLSENLYLCAVAIISITILTGLSAYLRGRSISYAAEGTAKHMRDMLYDHIQRVPYDYHKHVSTGDLIQRCTSDVDTVRRFVSMQLMEILRTVTLVIVASAIMFSINAKMALISICSMPVLIFVSYAYFKKVRDQFTLSDTAEGELSATLQENLTGVRVVRAFGQQQNEIEKFGKKNDYFARVTTHLCDMLAYYWGLTDVFGYLQIFTTTAAGIYFAVTSDFTLGNVLLFSTYTGMLTWPMRQLGRVLADMGKATVSMERLDEILSAEPEKEPGKNLVIPIKGDIEFKDVCFGYDYEDEVLKGISFHVNAGETVAILGSTGSGKSSLVQLLQRLYTCTRGEILLDGVNINDINYAHLRKNISIVLQEPFLYSRTIMDNIRITNPSMPEEEVYSAARTAAVHDVIMKFDKGYETLVGERGVTLSGGQQQRIAIARTLIRKAPILIFDDSMSAVDTETDLAIRTALKSIHGQYTTFIISHRITTLRESDVILVLDDGKLVQQGTHEELMKQEGIYKEIARIQLENLYGGEQA